MVDTIVHYFYIYYLVNALALLYFIGTHGNSYRWSLKNVRNNAPESAADLVVGLCFIPVVIPSAISLFIKHQYEKFKDREIDEKDYHSDL